MKLNEIISQLEQLAPPALQESYDNARLITGYPNMTITGVLTTLDCTEDVVEEALSKNCNLIVAHHPIIFGGLKSLTGKNYVERTVIKAIKNDVAIYAIHTNLDNVWQGVNRRIGDRLGIENIEILAPKKETLQKLFTFVPSAQLEEVRQALFEAGAGHIGDYDQCSFGQEGTGTFRGLEGTQPFTGTPGQLHSEKETKLEVVYPSFLKSRVIRSLMKAHPYEEVAYDIVNLANEHQRVGSGMIGTLKQPMPEREFLNHVAKHMKVTSIRHTPLLEKPIETVAWCGGAGSFLRGIAMARGADVFITGDFKYHEFFDADGKMVILDIGHFESEQFTPDLLAEFLLEKFPTFAVLLSEVKTNPVHYFTAK